jgi:hypothetical protein
MLKESYPYYLANRPEAPNADLEVTDKYTGEVVTRVAMADDGALERAIDAASNAAEGMKRLKPFERQGILQHCVQLSPEPGRPQGGSRAGGGKPFRPETGQLDAHRGSHNR